jgi:hypothetical protein
MRYFFASFSRNFSNPFLELHPLLFDSKSPAFLYGQGHALSISLFARNVKMQAAGFLKQSRNATSGALHPATL